MKPNNDDALAGTTAKAQTKLASQHTIARISRAVQGGGAALHQADRPGALDTARELFRQGYFDNEVRAALCRRYPYADEDCSKLQEIVSEASSGRGADLYIVTAALEQLLDGGAPLSENEAGAARASVARLTGVPS